MEKMEDQVRRTGEESVKAARENLVVDPGIFELDDEVPRRHEVEIEGKEKKVTEVGEGSYFLPANETESNRLNMQHQIFAISFSNQLSLAPIVTGDLEGKQALDIGTGTGIWAVDFANQYPNCHVQGFDISPCSPASAPKNTTFTTHDAESIPWPFEEKFTYIHGRAMMSCFDDAGKVIKEAWDKLGPGGWLELQDVIAPLVDIDNSPTPSTLLEFYTLTISAAKSIGRDVKQVITYPSLFSLAGFINIQEIHFQWPIGPWALDPDLKKVGVMFRDDLDRTLEPIAERLFVGVMKMGDKEVKRLIDGARRDLWDVKKVRVYMPGLVVYGQKPFQKV